MKYFLLLISIMCSGNASEPEVGKDGQISRIGNIDISVDKVGVLDYEKVSPETVSEEQSKALKRYFLQDKYKGHVYRIIAKKSIGKYMLFVCAEDNVADGGVDVVYSTLKKEVIGWYEGGIRG